MDLKKKKLVMNHIFPILRMSPNFWLKIRLFFFCLFLSRRSQATGQIRAAATGLHQSHSNTGSEPHLQTTPQLVATPDPQPTEYSQESNPQPHGS